MAQVFDHGLARPLRTLVRDGVIAALAPLLFSEGGYLAAVEKFAAVVRTDDLATIGHLREVLAGRSPAVLVALAGKAFEERGNTEHRWSAQLTVQVIVCSNNASSLVERLDGDAASDVSDQADPGIDVILEHVEELLIANNLAIGTKAHALRPISEEEIGTEEGETLWMQTYQVLVSRDVLDSRVTLERIASFMTTWRGARVVTDTPAQLGSELTTVSP